MTDPLNAGLLAWCDAARALYRFVLVRSIERELSGRRGVRLTTIRRLRREAESADAQDPRPVDQRPEPATCAVAERQADAYREQHDKATIRAYEAASQRATERFIATDLPSE